MGLQALQGAPAGLCHVMQIAFPLGFGPLFAPPLGFGPLFALIASKTDHFGPRTAIIGPDPLPRPPT